MTEKIKVFGAPASPYTQKIISILRYRHIPYEVFWGDALGKLSRLGDIEPPKPRLLPTLLLKDENGKLKATTDTTPIIRRFENEYPNRKLLPDDPALSFINYLLEDFGDEWVTKYMFHYRWYFDEDADNASTILPLSDIAVNMPDETLKDVKKIIHDRQTGRLWVVGSNDTTANLIDTSYRRFLKLMDDHLSVSKFLFGEKPSSADFAIFGQLTQLIGFDPTSREIAYDTALRLVSWQDVMADLSGHDVENSNWTLLEESPTSLKEIMKEFGRMYVPALIANANAIMQDEETWETEIDGSVWKQRAFPYQAKCLKWIKEEFDALNENDQSRVKTFLDGTGCEILLG
ncbi:MAG: glutathione S-transferase [Proteobacteria bacterium]|nr:glutathione S-transferase [Pseudomonadota bacterium]